MKKTRTRIVSLLLAVITIVGMLPLSAITAMAEDVPAGTGKYIARSWDSDKKQVVSTVEDIPAEAQKITADTRELVSGWYVLSESVTLPDGEHITVNGDAHLILANGALLTVSKGIAVTNGADLTFYAQTDDFDTMGKVVVTKAYAGNAGIGSVRQGTCGDITVNGGIFGVTGGMNAAGIGAGADGKCGKITVNGGKILAAAGDFAAGIGSGSKMDDGYVSTCEGVVINGGVIRAIGKDGAQNIGAGRDSTAVSVTVADGVYVKDEDACTYVNIGHYTETAPSCIAGHKEYFKNLVNGKCYTADTLESDTLIGDIEAWLAGDGKIGEGDGNHKDTNKDGYCDGCGTFAKVEVNYYISHSGEPLFTKTYAANAKLADLLDEEVKNAFSDGRTIIGHLYVNGYFVGSDDPVPFGTEGMDIYALVEHPKTNPDCTNNGHKLYYENTQDGCFYKDALCTGCIGDVSDLEEWMNTAEESGGGMMLPATGHSWVFVDETTHKCSVCQAEEAHTDDGTGKCSVCEGDMTCEHTNTEVVYEWNDDYTVCTATKRCSNCKEVFATETKQAYDVDFVLDTAGNCQTKHKGHNVAYFNNAEFGTAESPENSFEFGYGYHTDENCDGVCDGCEADLTVTGSIFKSGIFRFMITDGESKTVTVMDDDWLLMTEGNDIYLYPYEIAPTAYVGDLVIPETVTYGGKTFTVTAVGTDDVNILNIVGMPFMGCTGLTGITLPDTLTLIGESAFSGFTGLTEIVIPESVEKICSAAFFGCKNLKTVTFKSKDITKAPHGDIVVISAFDPENAVETVIVPVGTANAYKTEWECFADIIVEDNECTYLDENGETKTAVCNGAVNSNTTLYTTGWYALTEDAVFDNAIVINGDVKFILCNGAALTANKGILLTNGNKLTVYAQSAGDSMGKIIAAGEDLCAGIGSGFKQTAGDFTVNGGYIKATGGYAAPGIGGGFGGKDGTFTKNGGIVEAINGEGYISAHEHTYSENWSYNATYHWHDAICGHATVDGAGKHSFGNGVTVGNTTTYTCECGYTKVVYDKPDDEGEIVTGVSYTGISLTLGSDIAINFYMNLTEDARNNGKMTFNIGGRIVTDVAVKYNGTENKYYFSTPLTVLEMNEIVTATFSYNGVDYVQEYSVADYIDTVVGNPGKYGDEAVALAKKIANYGHYAQIYLASIHKNVVIGKDGYEEMFKCGDVDIDVAKAIEALKNYKVTVTGTSDNLSLYGSTVYFDSATALNYYVTVKNGAELNVTAVNTKTGIKKDVEIKLYKDNIYIVSVKDITATELADDIEVKINNELTITGSVFAYCNSVMAAHSFDGATEKDTFAVNAMAAFYEYYAAAYDYSYFKVSFDMNGHGEQVNCIGGLKTGDTVLRPDDPSEDGWVFCGWWTDEYCLESEWDFDADTVTDNITLYAKWEKIYNGDVYLNVGDFADDISKIEMTIYLSSQDETRTYEPNYYGNGLYNASMIMSAYAQLYMLEEVSYSIVFNDSGVKAIENKWHSYDNALMVTVTGKTDVNTYIFEYGSIQW